MLVWKGIEQEGAEVGTLGLFVKCHLLTKRKAEALRRLVARYAPHHVWLGGGRTNCHITKKAASALVGLGCLVYCEATQSGLGGLKNALKKYALHKVIVSVRTKVSIGPGALCLKFDDHVNVVTSTRTCFRSLADLSKKSMYDGDSIVYKGGKI